MVLAGRESMVFFSLSNFGLRSWRPENYRVDEGENLGILNLVPSRVANYVGVILNRGC